MPPGRGSQPLPAAARRGPRRRRRNRRRSTGPKRPRRSSSCSSSGAADRLPIEGAGGRRGTRHADRAQPPHQRLVPAHAGLGRSRRPGELPSREPGPRRPAHLSLAADGLLITDAGADHHLRPVVGRALRARAARAPPALPYAPLCDGRLLPAQPGRRPSHRPGAGHRVPARPRLGRRGDRRLRARPAVPRRLSRARARRRRQPPPARGHRGAPARRRLERRLRPIAAVVPEHLGIEVAGATGGQLVLGRWYRGARRCPASIVSVIEPQAVSGAILDELSRAREPPGRRRGHRRSTIWSPSISTQFDLGFALGTDHPRVGWSPRPPEAVRDAGLPGPDGIDTIAPLVTNGMVSPALVERHRRDLHRRLQARARRLQVRRSRRHATAAATTASSRRAWSSASCSRALRPCTCSTTAAVDMKTWSAGRRPAARARSATRARTACRWSSPIPRPARPRPAPWSPSWGPGNWSGSAAGELRALRAGACLQESGGRRFLIYGWFSTATPSAMARVFQAYGCRYAMLLDMNALEHTYLAALRAQGRRDRRCSI